MNRARGGMMLVENVAGVRLPRALNTLLAGIPAVGEAFQIMLPIAGVLVAIEVVSKLIEHHHALQESAEQLKGSQASLTGTIGSTFSGLQEKLLQAGLAADDLAGNHLAAVKKQLELIDHQSLMNWLRHSTPSPRPPMPRSPYSKLIGMSSARDPRGPNTPSPHSKLSTRCSSRPVSR